MQGLLGAGRRPLRRRRRRPPRRSRWTRTCARRCCATAASRWRATSPCARATRSTTDFGFPVFVKPARLGSSVGISKAHDRAELEAAVALAFRHDEKVLVEEFVDGVEVEVGVLGNRDPIVSPPGEIVVARNEWYDYEAKYGPGEMSWSCRRGSARRAQRRAQELALAAFAAIECEGMARVDMFVRGRRGASSTRSTRSRASRRRASTRSCSRRRGSATPALLERLIELALERDERRRRLAF